MGYVQIVYTHNYATSRISLVYAWMHTLDKNGTLLDNTAKHDSLHNTLKISHNNNLHCVIVDYSHMWGTIIKLCTLS